VLEVVVQELCPAECAIIVAVHLLKLALQGVAGAILLPDL